MYQSDYILREIEGLSRMLAKILFHRETSTVELIDEQNTVSGSGLFLHMLLKMLDEGKINEAEDLLYEHIERDPQPEYLEVAIRFYSALSQFSDRRLAECHYSREEIAEGLAAIRRFWPGDHP